MNTTHSNPLTPQMQLSKMKVKEIKDVHTPGPMQNKRKNLEEILDNINCNEVRRAAFPNYIGGTPDLTQSPPIKMKGKLTVKNFDANARSKSILATG